MSAKNGHLPCPRVGLLGSSNFLRSCVSNPPQSALATSVGPFLHPKLLILDCKTSGLRESLKTVTPTFTSLDFARAMDGAVYAHYETGQYTPTDIFLDDKEYGRALDTIVKGGYGHLYIPR